MDEAGRWVDAVNSFDRPFAPLSCSGAGKKKKKNAKKAILPKYHLVPAMFLDTTAPACTSTWLVNEEGVVEQASGGLVERLGSDNFSRYREPHRSAPGRETIDLVCPPARHG